MDEKTKLYDENGTYIGTMEDLIEMCGLVFIEMLEDNNKKYKAEHYKVERDEHCPEFEIRLYKGCEKCHRYIYCNSHDKK